MVTSICHALPRSDKEVMLKLRMTKLNVITQLVMVMILLLQNAAGAGNLFFRF